MKPFENPEVCVETIDLEDVILGSPQGGEGNANTGGDGGTNWDE